MKNNEKKNNKKIMFIMLAVLLILIVIVIAITLLKDKPQTIDKPSYIPNEAEIKEKLYNNVLISYILYGDIKLGEGYMADSENGEHYYAVVDDVFAKYNIKTYEDITKLIMANLNEEIKYEAIERLSSGEYNSYVSLDDQLFLVTKSPKCVSVPSFDELDAMEINGEYMNDSRIAISWKMDSINLYYINDNWLFNTLYYNCYDE